MPSLMTTAVLTIEYTPRAADLCYDIRLSGQWVASATTFHAADKVADEVRYRAFLAIPDEPPPDDGPGQDGDIDGVPQGACRACGDIHTIQRCPSILALLGIAPELPRDRPCYELLAA